MDAPAAPSDPTCPVLGAPLAVTHYAGAVDKVRLWAKRGDRAYLVEAANTHVVTLARHDRTFGAAMAQFDLWLPDGMPLVWAMNRQLPPDERLRDRVYGPTFMLRCLAATEADAESHFFLGGSEGLLAALQERLLARFPTLKVAGAYSPPFGQWSAEDETRMVERIAGSGARYIWVGLGCPKQEYWMSRNLARLPIGVYFGVGAAFAFHAGSVRQAPGWMQRAGLEWLFRLLAEPRRLLRRYVVYNSLFLYYLLRPPVEVNRS